MVKVAWMAAALLAAAACGDDGNHALPDGPAGSDAHPGSDGGPDGPVATRTISGTATYHFVTPAGDVTQPNPDLSADTVYGYSLENGAWVERGGHTSSDGTFSFPVDADATSWMWSVLLSQHFATTAVASSSEAPDLSEWFLGRPNPVYPTQETDTTFALDGMAPWVSGDLLELLVPASGGYSYGIDEFPLTEPTDGDTTIAQTVDWQDMFVPLVDSTMGDQVDLLHLEQVNDGSLSVLALTELAQVDDVTQADGQPGTLAATFTPVSRTNEFPLDWHGADFDAQRTAIGVPADAVGAGYVAIDALPEAEHGLYASSPDLAVWYGDATDASGTIDYANPFSFGKALWNEFVIYSFSYTVSIPVGSTTASLFVGFYGYDAVANLSSIGPALTPPTAIRMNGAATTGTPTITGATTTPTFSWAAPATGTPTSYYVQIEQPQMFGSFAVISTFVTFETTATSITVPDGYLTPGTTYIAVISALQSSPDFGTAPLLDRLGYRQADAVTAPFTP